MRLRPLSPPRPEFASRVARACGMLSAAHDPSALLSWIKFLRPVRSFPFARSRRPWALRTFQCLAYREASPLPVQSFILAADEARALQLARRELGERAVTLEIREGRRTVWRGRPGV